MRFDEGKVVLSPMGWNNVRVISNHRLTHNIPQESYFILYTAIMLTKQKMLLAFVIMAMNFRRLWQKIILLVVNFIGA